MRTPPQKSKDLHGLIFETSIRRQDLNYWLNGVYLPFSGALIDGLRFLAVYLEILDILEGIFSGLTREGAVEHSLVRHPGGLLVDSVTRRRGSGEYEPKDDPASKIQRGFTPRQSWSKWG